MAIPGILAQRAEESYRSPEDLQANRNLSDLGAGLIESGMETLGQGKAGKAVGDYLRAEWHRQEANTFQATVGKSVQERIEQNMNNYKQRTKMTQELGVEGQDPAELRKGYYSEFAMDGAPVPTSFVPIDDPMAVNQHLNTAASDMIGGMQGLSMEYMDAASEYPNNPLIEMKAKNLMGHLQATFQGQLEASKMVGEKMKAQETALDLEKKQEDARIRKLTLPIEEKIAIAAGEQQLDTIEQAKIKVSAMEESGRAIAAKKGFDGSAISREDALKTYYQDVLDTDKAMKQAKINSQKGNSLLPPGVGPHNIEEYLTMDKGRGLYLNFARAEEDAAIKKSPEVRRMINEAAYDLQSTAGVKNPIPFDQLPDRGVKDADGITVGQDMVRERVFVDNTDKNFTDNMRTRTMRKATSYLLGTPIYAADVGIKPKGGILSPDDANAPIFNDSDEALRVLKPELFTEENEELYAPKLEDEEYSGDPEDPFGPTNEDPESPISDGAPAREQDEVGAYAKWYDEFASDPEIPLGDKKKKARAGVRAVSSAIANIATRQSLDEYGLPTEEYAKEVMFLQKLRADLFGVINGKEGQEVPDNLFDDISQTWEDAAATVDELLGIMDANHEQVIKNTERGLRYIGFNPSKKARRVAGGIIDPLGSAVQNREAIIDSGVPYPMASPEEQKAREAHFNKGLKTGIF
jgi:hypothetical protein